MGPGEREWQRWLLDFEPGRRVVLGRDTRLSWGVVVPGEDTVFALSSLERCRSWMSCLLPPFWSNHFGSYIWDLLMIKITHYLSEIQIYLGVLFFICKICQFCIWGIMGRVNPWFLLLFLTSPSQWVKLPCSAPSFLALFSHDGLMLWSLGHTRCFWSQGREFYLIHLCHPSYSSIVGARLDCKPSYTS